MCGQYKMRLTKHLKCAFKILLLASMLFIILFLVSRKLQNLQRNPRNFTIDQCPDSNTTFVTVVHGGRLGNGIFEYLSTWALAKQMDAMPLVPLEILDQISVAFDGFTISALEDVADVCKIDFLKKVIEDRAQYEGNRTSRYTVLPKVTVLRKYAFDWQSLLPHWRELHHQLNFHPSILAKSQDVLSRIANMMNCTEFVAVHVRRTDYINYISSYKNATSASLSYYLAAMELMRKILPSPPVFIVTSDDSKWCLQNLQSAPDVFVIGEENSPESDLALLSSCNHTIFAYGTFGMTVAMFNADGQTIVFDTGSSDYYITLPFADSLSNWTKLSN